MIKKISQLDDLPLSAYDETKWGTDEAYKAEMYRKLVGSLFEVSYETNQANEAPSYYNSYKCTLNALSDMLDLEKVWAAINAIFNGALSIVAVSSDFFIGVPGGSDDCLPDHDRYPNDEHSVSCYYPFYEHNNMTCHKNLGVHEQLSVVSNTNLLSNLTVKGDSSFIGQNNTFTKNCYFTGPNSVFNVDSKATFTKVINGTAYRAQWGDLAEVYSADAVYEPGTLVKFGGKNEITVADNIANAVVTTEPGVVLNGKETEMENPTGIALVGKVPIKVRGPVKKFDNIAPSLTDHGIGVVSNYTPTKTIGKALEDNDSNDTKLVLCATKFNLN